MCLKKKKIISFGQYEFGSFHLVCKLCGVIKLRLDLHYGTRPHIVIVFCSCILTWICILCVAHGRDTRPKYFHFDRNCHPKFIGCFQRDFNFVVMIFEIFFRIYLTGKNILSKNEIFHSETISDTRTLNHVNSLTFFGKAGEYL